MRTKWTEELLSAHLTTPSAELIQDIRNLDGDILILGAGGKMGPTLCLLAQNAVRTGGRNKKVIAVSRFSDPDTARQLADSGVEVIHADLLAPGALDALPDAENVIYMAGKKFNTVGHEAATWAENAWLPSRVAQRYRQSRITVFSTGNIYPQMPLAQGGATEETPPCPVGEYAMSCLARERMFEYAAQAFGTRIAVYRLNYAVDLRYGVLSDIGRAVSCGEPVSLGTACFNCIWQGYAAEIALRCLAYADDKVFRLNVTGPETASVRQTALTLGGLLGQEPVFTGAAGTEAYLNDAGKMCRLFGYPDVPLATLIEWQAQWILDGGRELGKPTHFEEKEGRY